MRTRSQEKAAKSSASAPDPGGGRGGRGGVRRKRQAARTGAAAKAAAVENPVADSGPTVDADAAMVEAGDEVAGVKVEGYFVVAGGAVVMTDADRDGGVALLSDILDETESMGMLGTGGGGDGSDENVQVPDGEEREENLGVIAADLQTQEDSTARTVEQSACSATQHAGAEPNKSERFARYQLPCLDSGDIRVSDLVWSKLEGYPWWPGEVFDPSDASELALKHQIRGNHLVAHFGVGTFAWSNESQLMPFMTNYAQMEKQISSDEFINAVNYALEELSRRILSGMTCSCLPEELSGMSYLVENHGLKEGVTCSTANQAEVLKYFRPANLLRYVKSLALSPGQGGDLLELVIACSQLTSFYRSKGCPEFASYQTASGWADNALDASSTKNVTVEEDVTSVVHHNYGSPRKGRGRPRKRNPENGVELICEKAGSNLNNTCFYDDPGKRQMTMDIDVLDDSKNGKIRNLDSKPHNETTENGEIDIFGDDSTVEVTVLERAKWGHMHKNNSAEPKELLPQLFSVAVDPMNRNGFSEMIISYFSYYRNHVTASTEASIIGKAMPKRGRKRKIVQSPEVEMTDHLQDSYWSDLSLHNDPIHSLKRASTSTGPLRKQKSSQEQSLPSSKLLQPETLSPKKHIQVMERPIIHVDGKMPNESKPTALVLSFGRSAALPTEVNLIKMFSRYGPLKETETEVHKDTSTVKVVFKKRGDAESAFSVAGKYGTFGPSLRSYRLVNMPFSLSAPEVTNPVRL